VSPHPSNMSDPTFSKYIEKVTMRVFPQASNNRFALSEGVKRLLDLVQALTVSEFTFIRVSLKSDLSRDAEWDSLPARLELLSNRLEADGAYVDANIVHMAFEHIKVIERINANLMGEDENVPRYTTRRLKQEIARAVDAVRNGVMSDGPRADAIDSRNWSEGKE